MNLKQFSELLGISQTTISRALNGYPEVSEATRQRVSKAAIEHNYRPNTRARSLATGRSMAIGHIISQTNKHEMVNPIFGDFIAGAGEIYSKNNYEMVLSLVAGTNEDVAYRQMAAKASVDGMILHGPKIDDPRIALVTELQLPFVVHGRSSRVQQSYRWVDVNNRGAFERATRYLIDLGHTDIALLNGLETMDFASRRRTGYEVALQTAGMTPDASVMFSQEMTEVYGYRTMKQLLMRQTPPTAVLVASLVTALGVRRALEDAGLKMGHDISVMTHDDDLSYMPNGDDAPMFTAMKSSVREAGRLAGQLLLDVIANPDTAPNHMILEAELVIGQSTGPNPLGRTQT